ncbi:MAG: VIT1/CCC1 transporter family protein [Patescibacteria group bacterium]|nr:VIT1/CCC1 transporter family protein [Patescibacteria group bacterium]
MRQKIESHNTDNKLRDIILGGQDGLVNVLGVVMGVSAATTNSKILIAAGLAAMFAESISMAAVAYTSSLTMRDNYLRELEREKKEIKEVPETEKEEIRQIYSQKGFSGEKLEELVNTITSSEDVWLHVMMDEELHLTPVNTSAVFKTSVIVGLAAVIGSLIPVFPFFFLSHHSAFILSVIVSGISLFMVGAYEAKTMVGSWLANGFKMLIIGLGAAFIGFFVARLFDAS